MKAGNLAIRRARSFAALLLCALMAVALLSPLAARAQEDRKTVRVGWYESPFSSTDQYGRRSGYAYEYQRKLSAYTGWDYEYVEGSWPDLLQMLIDGDIDLLSDVSYTEERAEAMLFSDLPMGSEEYYIFTTPDNPELTLEDYASLSGKRIGVNKGSVQRAMLEEWLEKKGLQAEIVEMTGSEFDSIARMNAGEVDALVTLDFYNEVANYIPLYKIGASDFFFAVSKARPDLRDELESAMNQIQNEDRHYNTKLSEKYLNVTNADLYLSDEEIDWVEAHGPIRVGYQDNYLAFCACDASGVLTGALKDYLALASSCLENAQLSFEAVAYPTAAEAMDALKSGAVDCMFPANLTAYEGEVTDVVLTPAMMSTEIYAVVRMADQQSFVQKESVLAAVNQGNPNYEWFLADHFPGWQVALFPNTSACLDAVAANRADCILISNYRFNNIANQCEKLRLTTVPTGVDMDYSFAIREGETELYSLLTQVIKLVPDASINAALNYYSTEDARVRLIDIVLNNLAVIVAAVAVVALAIALLILRSVRSEQRALADEKLISAVEYDGMTGLYNQNFFFEFANQRSRERPDAPVDAVVINVNQFHSVNEMHGRDFGNRVLRALGEEARAFLEGGKGIGSRFSVDDFCLFCEPQADYHALLERFQSRVNRLSDSASVRLRMGVMPWKRGLEPVQMIDRARTACGRARGSERHLLVYDDAMQEREHLNEHLLNDLDRALRDREFKVYYQPKFNITVDPPCLSSAEALVRWQHPELGLISPDKFIPLFEENGLIHQLDYYVWREVAAQMAAWREKYGVVIPVSVNVSRIDLHDPDFISGISALVKEFRVRHEDFLLEITESAYTEDSEQIVENVKKLREAGFLIEMDDFGSGYSSLNMISTLPIDVIKLDMQFIRNAFRDHSDTRMLEAVLGIADMLYVPTVAEGVETLEQLNALRAMGCDIVQGYYFSKPVPPEEYEAFIRQRMQVEEDVPSVELLHHMSRLSYEDYSYDELHDSLTGMYNRTAFDMLARDADQYHTALLLVEILEAGRIQAEQGQAAAELALQYVADVLRRSFRPVDHICRISGCEFGVIMSRVNSGIQGQVARKIERVNELLKRPVDSLPVLSLAVGVAFADRANPGQSIQGDAQAALDALKARGGAGCAFHGNEIQGDWQ